MWKKKILCSTIGDLDSALFGCMRITLREKLAAMAATQLSATAAMASDGRGLLSADYSLCLVHGPEFGQPFLCGHQSSEY